MRNHYQPWFRSTVRVLPPPREVPNVAFARAMEHERMKLREWAKFWVGVYGGCIVVGDL